MTHGHNMFPLWKWLAIFLPLMWATSFQWHTVTYEVGPWGYLWRILIVVIEVGRAAHCGWQNLLTGILDHVNGEWKLRRCFHLFCLSSDHRCDVMSCCMLCCLNISILIDCTWDCEPKYNIPPQCWFCQSILSEQQGKKAWHCILPFHNHSSFFRFCD